MALAEEQHFGRGGLRSNQLADVAANTQGAQGFYQLT
jgi:hypothetical protein